MGRKRVWVAAIFIPFFYLLVKILPPWTFFVFVAIGIMLALYEFYAMYYRDPARPEIYLGMIAGALMALLFSLGIEARFTNWVALLIMGVLLFELFFKRDLQSALTDGAVLMIGIWYIGWLLGHLILVRKMAGGEYLIFYVFLVTWACDTGAYYAGKGLGRRPLAPRVSPNKTIEGAVGGMLLSVGVSLIARAWFLPVLNLPDALFLGISMGLMGQLGDLTESMFKRGAGIKDSGTLLPAHGGILDRVDSLIFTVPTFYYYLIWFKQYGRGLVI